MKMKIEMQESIFWGTNKHFAGWLQLLTLLFIAYRYTDLTTSYCLN